MRKIIYKIYLILVILEIKARHFFFGFENVNNRLHTVEKGCIRDILSLYGASIDQSVEIESPIYLNAKKNYLNLHIGKNAYIGKACFLDLKGKISIGENAVISMQSTLVSHIDLGKNNALAIKYPVQHPGCTIGSNCYIGARSTVLLGVTLNEGSFVAAGSVVIDDVPPYTLVAGIPAIKIKEISKN